MNVLSSSQSLTSTLRRITIVAVLSIFGCSAQPSSPVGYSISNVSQSGQSADAAMDTHQLNELFERRTHDSFGSGSDFALGPGDVMEISVPLEELEHREFRVSSDDTITLPLVGVMSIKGMTEEQLTNALRQRLSKYMHNPPIVLFVKHYANRDVAVTGAVEKPGLYTLQSASDTLGDMISRAGGATGMAAAQVLFVPAASTTTSFKSPLLGMANQDAVSRVAAADDSANPHPGLSRVSAISPDPPSSASSSIWSFATMHPISINTNDPKMQQYLNIPARPGDMLVIPSAGEVTVGGWVQNPGAYKVTPGMTALSTVSAAGGALFSSSGAVLRTNSDGQRVNIPFSISKIQKGEQTDVPVQAGDVVMVDRSTVGAVPYALYEVFTKFGTGMYLPAP